MKQQKILFRVLLAIIAGLILVGICIVLPLTLIGGESEESESESQTQIAGEGDYYGKVLLFGPFNRKTPQNGDFSSNLYKIVFHNDSEEYAFVHPTAADYMSFYVEKNGKVYDSLSVDLEQIASVVVAAGTPYVRERIAEGEDAVSRYEEYGLADSQTPAYCDVTVYGKTLTEVGETYRLYIGSVTTDGNGYFARVEGRDAIYVTLSPTLGDLVNSGAGLYVSPKCTPDPTDNYAHYFIDDFRVTREVRSTEPVLTTAVSTVRVTETCVTTYPDLRQVTKTAEKQYYLSSAAVPEEVRNALIGKTVGETLDGCTAHVEKQTASEDGFVTVTYDYTFTEILCAVEKTEGIGFSFITKAKDRDYYSGGTLYKLDTPDGITPYFANDTTITDVLANFQQITGTSTFKLGFTDEDRTAYKLFTKITYRLPTEYTSTTEGIDLLNIDANTVSVTAYTDVTLYVSDKREDGTYLVGSPLFDLIAVVDGSTFSFLDYDMYTWVTPKLMSSYMNLVKTMSFDFDYDDFKDDFTFNLAGVVTRQTSSGDVEYISIPLNGTPVVYDSFSSFYYYLLWQRYSGECELLDAERELLSADGTVILRMTVTLYSGERYVYRFIPYTEGRVLVAVGKGENAEDAVGFFYVPMSSVKTYAFDLASIRDGKGYPGDEKYE